MSEDWGNDPIQTGAPPTKVSADDWGNDPVKMGAAQPHWGPGQYSASAEMTPTPDMHPIPPEAPRGILSRASDAAVDAFKGPYGMAEGSAMADHPMARALFRSTIQPISKVVDAAGRPLAAAGGALAGAAAGAAEDLGMKPSRADALERDVRGLEQSAVVAGVASPVTTARATKVADSNVRPSAIEARQAGYVLPPASISEKPGLVSNVLAGWSGKIKTQQAASAKNQAVTNDLATKALGLPPETVLTDEVFNKVRQQAGQAYQSVVDAVPTVKSDDPFKDAVTNLGGQNGQAAKAFPKIVANQAIHDLAAELKDAGEHPTGAWVELVKELRFNANANLKAIGDPSKHALGLAQREAANAVDDMMERQISASGKPDAIASYKAARQLIAKSYDVEGATNSATGDVSARGLARLSDKGRPLSGELKIIADAASAFPKAMQSPAGFGDNEAWSALDFFGSAAAMAHGNPGVAATILGRPLARAAVLSRPYQNMIAMPTRPRSVPLQVPAGILNTKSQPDPTLSGATNGPPK